MALVKWGGRKGAMLAENAILVLAHAELTP
jgi:hypothetical protein